MIFLRGSAQIELEEKEMKRKIRRFNRTKPNRVTMNAPPKEEEEAEMN